MKMNIDDHKIGIDESPLLVAEIGMNHNGDSALGKKMIREAKKSGADAVKFQSFRTDAFLSSEVENREKYRDYQLTDEDHEILLEEANQMGITFFSTPFDRKSVDLLEELDVPCFKVASSDVTNYHFLEYIAKKKKPMILSTGYANHSEVAEAVRRIKSQGNNQLVLLHCLSSYPAPPEKMNLKAIRTLRSAFNCPVGLSDHSQNSNLPSIIATAFGAAVIEKHFTTDQSLPGFDHGMSTEPDEFQQMMKKVQTTVNSLGDGEIKPAEIELGARQKSRRSLFWKDSYPEGSEVQKNMFVELRPGSGIAPRNRKKLLGKKLSGDVVASEQVQYSDFVWNNS